VRLTARHNKNELVTRCHNDPLTWKDSSDKRHKVKKIDISFGTWNVRSLYRVGSVMTVAKEVSKHKLELVGI
jgi:hypothetical protein